jgi:hypothetical protein
VHEVDGIRRIRFITSHPSFVRPSLVEAMRDLPKVYPSDIKAEFKKLRDRLKVYEEHPFERRAFLYLDIISWLESNYENRPVAEIVKEKFREQKRFV